MLMPSLELGVRFLVVFWFWIQTCSAATNWWLRTKWALPVLQASAQRSETSLWVLYPYRSWWWWALRWGERSPTLLAGGSPRHACAAAHRSSGGGGGSQRVSPGWSHMLGWSVRRVYRHEQDAVVRAAQFGDAVQEHGWHLLVSVLDESEDLEGKTPRLALAVLEDRRLWVFTAPAENTRVGSRCGLSTKKGGARKTVAFIWNKPFSKAWMDNDSLLWFIESASWRRNRMPDYRKKRS